MRINQQNKINKTITLVIVLLIFITVKNDS